MPDSAAADSVKGLPILGYLAGLLAVLLWSGHIIISSIFADDISPVEFVFSRWAIGCFCLFLAFRRQIRDDFPLFKRAWLPLSCLGLLGSLVSNGLGYLALDYTDPITIPITIAVINANLPLIVALLGLVLGRRALSRRGIAGLLTAALGLLLLAGRDRLLAGLGLHLIALACNLAWALYTVFYSDLCPRGMSRPAALFYSSLPAVVASFLLLLASGAAASLARFDVDEITALAFAGIGVSFVAYLAYTHAVVALGPERAANFLHLVPAITAGLSFLWLGDPPSPLQIAAALIVLVGITLLQDDRQSALASSGAGASSVTGHR